MDDSEKLSLLNVLANPKGTPPFATEEDFENKVLVDIKNLLNKKDTVLNKDDEEFALTQCVIERYYSIHKDIRVDKDLVLLLSIRDGYKKLSPSNKIIKKEMLEIINNQLMFSYIIYLARTFHSITCSSTMNGPVHHGGTAIYTKDIASFFNLLSQNQDSSKFEKVVMNPKNIAHQYDEGETILHLAVKSGYIDLVDDLVKNGTNIEETLLHLVIQCRDTNMAKYLIGNGANVNSQDWTKRTPLDYTAEGGHIEIARLLLEKGANPSLQNIGRDTPLHLASQHGRTEIVKLLLEKGANPLLKNKYGKTPKDLAKNKDIIQLLEAAETKYINEEIKHKAVKTGVALGVIAAITVVIGCVATNVGLPILLIASIAVATALAIGCIAGGITYAVLKPDDKLNETTLSATSSPLFRP